MKRFVFRLQVVLDRARQEEEQALQRLGEAQAERVRKEQEIGQIETHRQQLRAWMVQQQQQAFDPREAQESHLRLAALGNDVRVLQDDLLAIERRITERKAVVIEAMRKRKVLETLREKQHVGYKHEMERMELQVMEEAVLPRLAREKAMEAVRLLEEQGRSVAG